jgi:hypothetical protein
LPPQWRDLHFALAVAFCFAFSFAFALALALTATVFPKPIKPTVISTEAARAFASSAAEKSASLPLLPVYADCTLAPASLKNKQPHA